MATGYQPGKGEIVLVAPGRMSVASVWHATRLLAREEKRRIGCRADLVWL